jgi:cell division protein FtsZ
MAVEAVEPPIEEPAPPAPNFEIKPVSFGATIDRSSDSFIPPRPIDAPPRPSLSQAPMQQSAHQHSAQPPAQSSAEKKRSYSLFERVTGAARRAESAAAPAAPQPQRAIPTLGTGTATRGHHVESNIAPAGQPRLGIDAPVRPKASTPEDDLLEIPAFLRRQAN